MSSNILKSHDHKGIKANYMYLHVFIYYNTNTTTKGRLNDLRHFHFYANFQG